MVNKIAQLHSHRSSNCLVANVHHAQSDNYLVIPLRSIMVPSQRKHRNRKLRGYRRARNCDTTDIEMARYSTATFLRQRTSADELRNLFFHRPTFYPGNSEVEWSLELASKDTIISKDCDFSSDLATLCPNEKWMILDLDHNEWRGYSKFTLRISWPASVSSYHPLRKY